jgi:hypothetical protein
MMNKFNWNDYKYIVSTGCSYGVVKSGITHEFSSMFPEGKAGGPGATEVESYPFDLRYDNLNDNVIVISCALSSSGARWQSDSSIYVVGKLLEMGVHSDNIYCFVEWSEFQRNTFTSIQTSMDKVWKQLKVKWNIDEQDIRFIDKDNKRIFRSQNPNEDEHDILTELKKYIKVGVLDSHVRVGVIEDEYYITPSQVPALWNPDHGDREKWGVKVIGENAVKDVIDIKLDLWGNHLLEIDKLLHTELMFHDYIDYIVNTQNFLKLNNIKYNFTFINSQFSKWLHQGGGTIQFDRKGLNDLVNQETFELQKIDTPNTKVEDVFTNIKQKFKNLDLSNIYFHNSDRYQRGGIDEILLDKLGPTIYNQPYMKSDDFSNHGGTDIPNFGLHPKELLYSFVWDIVASNCNFLKLSKQYLDFIETRFNQDLENTDYESYNGLTLNKKLNKQLWTQWIKNGG